MKIKLSARSVISPARAKRRELRAEMKACSGKEERRALRKIRRFNRKESAK